MEMLRKGDWVWLDTDVGVPIGASVKETPSGQRILVDDDGKEQSLTAELEASLRIMHPTSVEGVDDMIKLGDMNEAGLLRNLLLRHKQGLIYTYTGSVLVAVNPYQEYPIYSNEQVKLYHGRKLGELPPHIFGIAECCYFNMRRHSKNQCCIISGESGAGKTESTKLILQYLAAISGERSEQQIEKQILESNPILEAFGNAKTIRNDNSSRFGKYLEIFFNKDGVIEGARIEQYLLEKSRVCHQALEERSYHIFYCMLAGITAEERNALSLGNAEEYIFLTKGACIVCDGRDDAKDFDRIRSALKVLTFSENQILEILKLLASILHLGNVQFEATIQNNLETSDVSKSQHFAITASLLNVQKSSLARSLTHRSFMTNRESVTKPLTSEEAAGCRDAFVKAIYNKLFIWIVGKINSVIYETLTTKPKSSYLSIGLLDIFGFENFKTNSFEQLCINFANEKLQQFFVGHIFKLEQKEYLKEEIVWNNIKFSDNQNILDLLAGKPCNVLALIDEESHFPKGSDLTMLTKLNQHHSQNKTFIASRRDHDTDFGIRHFAGVVYYDSNDFLEKNRDAVSSDIIKMIHASTNELLRQIFETELTVNDVKITNNKRVIMTPRNSLRAPTDNRKQVPTLSGQFRQSLDALMRALSVCQPFFIRCFKPNNDKQSEVFNRELCVRQLRYSGMMDTIRIRKLGYPIRHTFTEFLNRYRVLLRTSVCNPKTATPVACCEAICRAAIKHEEWKIGRTKIFLKDAHDAALESLREQELNRKAVVIQRVMLGHRDRKSFLRKRSAAVLLQRNWRVYLANRERTKALQGFERLVSTIRGRKLQSKYQRQRAAALVIQCQVRGYLARKECENKRAEIEEQKLTALRLQQRLEEIIAEASQSDEEPEPTYNQTSEDRAYEVVKTDEEPDLTSSRNSVENLYNLLIRTSLEGAQEKTLEFEETQSTSSSVEKVSEISVPPTSNPTTPNLSLEEDSDEFDDDSDPFSFYKFSLLHFQDIATHAHVSQRLKKPLLPHDDEGDEKACLTISWIILRFMGDISEQLGTEPQPTTINRNLPQRQARRLSSLVGLDQKILRKNKKKLSAGNRRASVIPEEPENLTEDEDLLIGEGPTLDRPLSPLEKLHIIIGYALSRPDIRDEIYCQICKQLVNNRNTRSRKQGWALLALCLGIFPPTELFMKYLESFIRKGPSGYKEYCTERLRRIIDNGERKELPCWVELQAAISKKPIEVSVSLMDGQAVDLQLESASTSAEVCQAVAEKIGLRDTYGFSLYISFQEKMWSLGSSGKHVFDAVSQCEQEMRRQGKEEKDTVWTLSIRKELFTPWHDCLEDPVSTDLIYRQVIKGIKSGEYTNDKEDEYVQVAAQHYYIQYGSDYIRENMQKVVEECISTTLIENKSMTRWIQLITAAHLQGPYVNNTLSREKVKGELVNNAQQRWPLDFSRFYEVTMISGPPLPKSRFVVAVNWSGVFFMEGRDRRLLDIPYLEVKKVNMNSEGHFSSQSVSLSTVSGDYVLRSAAASDMAALIDENVEGLRQRSVFAQVQRDISKQADPMWLPCKRGDLLMVDKNGSSPDQSWIRATNQRTNSSGAVDKDALQFLPTLSRPTDEMLELLSPRLRKISAPKSPSPGEDAVVLAVSLKEFATENFRPVAKDAGRHGASRGISREKLWVSSREPLKQPLLKNLQNSDLSPLACNAFTAILKYMGDYPIKHARSPMELTDQIFGPATQHQELQDEIYCQIMRQMTLNSSRLSLERGWQLMWLCTGLFPPSPSLMKHAVRFLESRPREPLSEGCLQRLQDMCSKEPRKLPPHVAEVDAIQQNSTKIFHKVHFPNDTNEIFEVTSTTTIKDLCWSIASQLKLNSAEGYGLYVKTLTKLVSLEEQKYFFDGLKQKSETPKKGRKGKEGNLVNAPCLVICKRKLWFNVSPGKDEVADLTFHFPQEMSKYLHGYHSCSKEDMFRLGGLLFRVKADSDRSQFVMIPKMLPDLVPADQQKLMQPEDWKKHIISSYKEQSGITVQEAKIAFLRVLSSWPTFGCAFFEVKQTCDSSYPSTVWIAINKKGVNLIDPKTKELLVMHAFNRIIQYRSKSNSFQMTISTLVKSTNFTCETTQAPAIEDLLRSYVNMYEAQTRSFLSRSLIFT